MFRVVFSGEIVPGFNKPAVIAAAAQRMKATQVQIDKVFSGRKVTLKKGLSDQHGAYYVAELKKMGMQVSLEREPQSPPANQTQTGNKGDDIGKSTALTASMIFGSRSNQEDDWAIASIHEYARMEDMRNSFADTDVNQPYVYSSAADPVLRDSPTPRQVQSFAGLGMAANSQPAAPVTARASAAQSCCCPHCGKALDPALFAKAKATATANTIAAMPIRPGDSLQVSPNTQQDKPEGSWARLTAKLNRILPKQSAA
ncbi:hypothetical protein [Uliginosibacterium gangwonense]|uniref:hypothetical protein n=1 Tax=Uliginosibacterium gangwonense TaxID=392736 RepID=UPI000378C6D8|nr:hypothetical protein [Uliginosibacterium gangwonense]